MAIAAAAAGRMDETGVAKTDETSGGCSLLMLVMMPLAQSSIKIAKYFSKLSFPSPP